MDDLERSVEIALSDLSWTPLIGTSNPVGKDDLVDIVRGQRAYYSLRAGPIDWTCGDISMYRRSFEGLPGTTDERMNLIIRNGNEGLHYPGDE